MLKDTEERKAKELLRREEQKKRAEAAKAARLREQAENEALERSSAAAASVATTTKDIEHKPATSPPFLPANADVPMPRAHPPSDIVAPHTVAGGLGWAGSQEAARTRSPAALDTALDAAPSRIEIEPSTQRPAAGAGAWATPPPSDRQSVPAGELAHGEGARGPVAAGSAFGPPLLAARGGGSERDLGPRHES